MAHFAKLGIGNKVEKVVVVSNDIATTEQAGIDFLNNLDKRGSNGGTDPVTIDQDSKDSF